MRNDEKIVTVDKKNNINKGGILMKKRILSFMMALAIAVTGSFVAAPAQEAAAAVIDNSIITEGEGTITKTLSNGKTVQATLSNSVLTLTVDGQPWSYYNTPSVGTLEISDDDVLHAFWHSGHYYAFDLYEQDAYVMLGYNGVDQYNVDYYIVTNPNDPNKVLGTAAGMANKTCILDKQYFKMYGQVLKKRLITRAQLEELIYGKKATPTPVPTVVPTAVPTAVPTVVPTQVPQFPTQAPPVPTKAPTPTLKPLPTQHPNTPTTPPDVVIDTTIEWSESTEYNLWVYWHKNLVGTITWEEYAKSQFGESWQETSRTDEWYYYNEQGQLIHKSIDTNTIGKSEGTSITQTNGSATVTASETGEANLTGYTYTEGHAAVHTELNGNGNCSLLGTKSKNVVSWSVKEPKGKKGYVCLVKTVNGISGVVCRVWVDYIKHIAKFGGKRYTKIRRVRFTSKSRQIIMRYLDYTSEVVPRAKGSGKYTSKKIKTVYKYESRTPSGLLYSLNKVKNGKGKTFGVAKIQPKKLK